MQTTKEDVRRLHNKQKTNGENNQQNSQEIVNILGGIDQILTNYLSESSNIAIYPIELTKLNQLLQTPLKFQQHNKPQLQPSNKINESKTNTIENPNGINSTNVYYYLDENNTYLHSIFGEETCDKLLKVIHNNCARFIVFLLIAFTVALRASSVPVQHSELYLLHCLLLLILLFPYCIILMLSINKTGWKLILFTFEFWYKLMNGIYQGICDVWILTLDEHISGYNYNEWIYFFSNICTNIMVIFIILYVSSLDAYNMNNVICTSSIALLFFVTTTKAQIEFYHQTQDMHLIDLWLIELALEAAKLNAWWTLVIFFGKQAFLSINRYNNKKCISIKCVPTIQWNTKRDVAYAMGRTGSPVGIGNGNLQYDVNSEQISLKHVQYNKKVDLDDESSASSIFDL